VNRHERRAAAAKQKKDQPEAFLALHCAGPFSVPPLVCDRTALMKMPFDLEELRRIAWAENGWFVTVITPPGIQPMAFTVLCPVCAEALVPELVAAARRVMPGSA